MKTNYFTNFALIIVIVAAVSSSAFGQRWNNNKHFVNNQTVRTQPTCIALINNLTESQITKITALEEKHQEVMDELRTERRSTINTIEKNNVREKMLAIVDAHQNEVLSLLNEEQQNQYALLHTNANPNYGQGRQFYGAGNQAFIRGAGRGNCCARVGRGFARGAGNNQVIVRGNDQRNFATTNNTRFNRGGNRQGNMGMYRSGRNANYGRGFGRGLNNFQPDTIQDLNEN